MKKLLLFLGFALLLISIWLVVHSSQISLISPNSQTSPIPKITLAKVIKVIDGDTIEVEGGQKVRYIGINTPELEINGCYATEANKINSDLVLGKTVKLEKDINEVDKYGRLLRYVYVDNTFINDELVKDGSARVETVKPDVKYESEFVTSEKFAKVNHLGLWGKCF